MDIEITFISDPGCPWGYSASPSLAALEWRYGPRLSWRLVTIGLAGNASMYESRGYDPIMMGQRMEMYRQFGMPFTVGPRARLTGTGRACRAIHAVRLMSPGDEITAFRALQFGWFTTRMLMDEDPNIATALERVPGLDVPAVMAMNTSGCSAAMVVISLVTVGAAASCRTDTNSLTMSALASAKAFMPPS